MPFIKAQKIIRDEEGKIITGSASLVDAVYTGEGKFHSKQVIRERLGKILYLDDDKRGGIFQSPSRGLVGYSCDRDEFFEVSASDERIAHASIFMEPPVHAVFGDVYLLLNLMKNSGMTDVLRKVFPKNEEYERLLAHTLHAILKDGSRITCDLFIEKSFASMFLSELPVSGLRSDTRFFDMMGKDDLKTGFFREFVRMMRRKDRDFGKGCYVDSTPLPNSIDGNPFNALCCHGAGSSCVQTRLVLVLDSGSGLPVWFDIIPGNVLDLSTLGPVLEDVKACLDITIDSMVLDAGYVSKEIVEANNLDNGTCKEMIARMPARKGYPFKDLYHQNKSLFPNGKYSFIRNGHAYFGVKREIELFGCREYAYVYLDRDNALNGFKQFVDQHGEEFESMKDKDKTWIQNRYGYFVLLSNIDTEPPELLDRYFSRTEIESVFKTSKEYLGLLPLSKWTDGRVRGKILHDVIDLIIYLQMRKSVNRAERSMTEAIGRTQSLMCINNGKGRVLVETPNRQTRETYQSLSLRVPDSVDLCSFKKDVILL